MIHYYTNRSKVAKKPIGVYIGRDETHLAYGCHVYMAYHTIKGAITDAPARPSRSGGSQSVRDRMGLHTFRRSDLVSYKQLDAGEAMGRVAVFGVAFHQGAPDDKADQGRKFLILYEIDSQTFFSGSQTAWERLPIHEAPGGETFDVDTDSQVLTMGAELCQEMVDSWASLTAINKLSGNLAKAQREMQEPPPTLKTLRKRKLEKEKAEKKKAEREKAEKEKAAAAAAAKVVKAEKAAKEKAARAKQKRRKKQRPPPPPKRRGASSGPPPPPKSNSSSSSSSRTPSPSQSPVHRRGRGSPPSSPKRARHASPASSCSTPWDVVKAREELAAAEAASLARARARLDRHERKRHEKKQKRGSK